MEKIDQILDSLYDRVIEPIEAKEGIIKVLSDFADSLTPAVKESLTAEPMTVEEIPYRTVLEWLQKKKYQTERGEQEYLMYFDVDMPKILNAFLQDFASKPTVAKREVSDECEHPYAYVYRKGDYESCTKCGKELCNG